MEKLKEALTYDDVLLTPQYSDVESRKEIYIGNFLGDGPRIKLDLPIISAPMDTVTGPAMVVTMAQAGGLLKRCSMTACTSWLGTLQR